MSIKSELEKLNEPDIWSLMLFVLFQIREVPEYSGLSELAYILDKKNLLKLCEYFGGSTIKIPTINEFEMLLYGLLVYNYVAIEHMEYDDAVLLLNNSNIDGRELRATYNKIRETMEQYDITPRGRI